MDDYETKVAETLELIGKYRKYEARLRKMAQNYWMYYYNDRVIFEEAADLFANKASALESKLTVKDKEEL